jgi:hypothetical protein
MKAILGFALLVGMQASAQAELKSQPNVQFGQRFNFPAKDSVPEGLKQRFQLWKQNGGSATLQLLNGRNDQTPHYIGETKLGPVYALPQDNMPCIMPSIAGGKMPNPSGKNILTNPIDPGIYLRRPGSNKPIAK